MGDHTCDCSQCNEVPESTSVPAEWLHAGCGGAVIDDADFISGDGDGDEWWWNYRCTRCNETFQTKEEFQTDEQN